MKIQQAGFYTIPVTCSFGEDETGFFVYTIVKKSILIGQLQENKTLPNVFMVYMRD